MESFCLTDGTSLFKMMVAHWFSGRRHSVFVMRELESHGCQFVAEAHDHYIRPYLSCGVLCGVSVPK